MELIALKVTFNNHEIFQWSLHGYPFFMRVFNLCFTSKQTIVHIYHYGNKDVIWDQTTARDVNAA